MDPLIQLAARFGVALGIGLIIGAERERHKRLEHRKASAGLRTITLIALAGGVGGALARVFGGATGAVVLAAIFLSVTALVVSGYFREPAEEPGMTTEVAEVLTLLLGVLAMYEPTLAAGLAVVVAILLVARSPLHTFVTSVLSEQELWDALLFLAATLVVLPLLPNTAIDPYGVFVPARVWAVAVLVMAIGAAGHIAIRALGPSYGLPVVGLASGFVSSVAAVGAMGGKARANDEFLHPAVAGATLSTLATIVQLGIILAIADVDVLSYMLVSLLPAGIVAAAYGGLFTLRATRRQPRADSAIEPGRAFDPKAAVLFALAVTALLFVAAIAQQYLGAAGAVIAAGLAGFADTHSAAFSVASLAGHDGLPVRLASLGVLLAFSANTVTKSVVAWVTGGRPFFARVTPGLVLVLVAMWAGWVLGAMLRLS